MPRTSHKKRLLNPHKSQLLFVEAPINGPKHEYGPQLRSAIHPRSFTSEKQPAPCTSWVSPQFNSLETAAANRGKRANKAATKISNKVSVLGLPQTRKTRVCKYTPLFFGATTGRENQRENLRSSWTKNDRLVSSDNHRKELQETSRRTRVPRKVVERRVGTRVTSATSSCTDISKNLPFRKNGSGMNKDSIHTPNTSTVPEPPNVETPEMPHCSSNSPANVQNLLFSPNQAKTPPRTGNTNILVMDTPEKDYGLKVTWRRRKELMKLLIDRGQLLLTDAEVANEWT